MRGIFPQAQSLLAKEIQGREALYLETLGKSGGQLRSCCSNWSSAQRLKAPSADNLARVQDIDNLDWKTALGIGVFQVLAIVPGTSRSGATILGGLALGCSRAVAAEFTFFLAIPTMAGASALRLVRYFMKGNTFTIPEAVILGVGCLVAFIVSLVMVRALMGYVRKHDFKPFGVYRIILGIAVIAYFLLVK